MKANFKFVLRTGKKDATNRSPIFLRVTSHYKVKFISTGRKIQERFWNKDREQVRSGHPDSVELNQFLEDFLRTAREQFRRSGFDPNGVNKSTVVPDVLSMIENLINNSYNRPEQRRCQQKFSTLKAKLIKFAGPRIPFDSVTKSWILDFDEWLRLNQANQLNTRLMYLKALRHAINMALEEGLTTTPFPKVKMSEEQTEKRRLTIEQIKMLQEYDAPVGSHRYNAKNMFLLSFFIGGSRFEDTVSLEWAHIKDGTIRFKMAKSGKPYQIGLLPEALKILDLYMSRFEHKYVFPLLNEHVSREDVINFKKAVSAKNALVNKKLAVIAKHLGIEKFSFHCARHSIADYLRLKKVDLYTISKILRHSNLKTTEIYLKQFDTDSVSKEFAKAFKEEV